MHFRFAFGKIIIGRVMKSFDEILYLYFGNIDLNNM